MRIATLLVGLFLVTGCGDDGERAASSAASGGRLSGPITFEVAGGEAVRRDRMTVAADGAAQVRTRAGERRAKLTASELRALTAAVEDAELGKTDSAKSDPPAPDALSYRVRYRGRAVETDSAALDEVEQLRPLIGTFSRLIKRYGAR